MKVLAYNFSALCALQGNEGTCIREGISLNRLPDLSARGNTIVSATESYSGMPEKFLFFFRVA
jgi:hypothetical protein